jgi:RHS repeat-associated protein
VVTKYVYDQEDILFELDENGQIRARYTHGPGIDEPISVDRDTDSDGTLDTTWYYNFDGLGSVTTLTDSSGNIVQTYVYDSFGNIVNQTGSVENTYTYTGREWDEKAGLYYYRTRYYDPGVGRFLSQDTIGFNGGDVNFYVYVLNNPVNYADPWGLITPDRISGFNSKDPYEIYERNRQKYYSELENNNCPISLQSALDKGWEISRDFYHTQPVIPGAENNIMLLSPEGHREGVYNNGIPVTDAVNRPTFNRYDPRRNPVKHTIYDVGVIFSGVVALTTQQEGYNG